MNTKQTTSALYVETSFVLAWLFGETHAHHYLPTFESASMVATSVLTVMEVERSLMRAHAQKKIKVTDRTKLLGLFRLVASGWVIVEISKSVREHVGVAFPLEPVRTLDAIHLATATLLLAAYPDLKILSLDRRVAENAEALGFDLVA